jgi:vacuolar-type H+-ATPase subunit I/STV1
MHTNLDKLDNAINKLKFNLRDEQINNNNNKDNKIFNGINEIIQEINNNYETKENKDESEADINKKTNIKENIRNNNYVNFVFSTNHTNHNLNIEKGQNVKDFGVESLTKRKPFGDFNFE